MKQLLGLLHGMYALQLLSRDSMYLTHFISRHAPTSECALWITHTITIDPGLYMSLNMKVTQLCLTICNPMDDTVHGILYPRILKW